ncbi:MAG: LCP family protein, partial [Acidaminococcaceae bacterium]
ATPVVPVTVANDETLLDETLNRRINVLILGIDDGDSEDFEGPKRTDAMLVASFDPDHNEVALVSIPRDTRVQIPGRVGLDKINHAHAYGGVLLAKQTVANLLKIPIHYYVLLNWQGFIDVINIIGGVDMYVEDNMNYEDPYADLKIHITKGYQHLDGKLAGEYVRFRSDELGDIGRVQRQQRFLKALASEFFNLTNVIK